MHASLAPHFGYSYRGAYYPAGVLSDQDILSLRTAATSHATKVAVDRVFERLTGRRPRKSDANQLQLLHEDEEGSDDHF
jgi:hypothetical protein